MGKGGPIFNLYRAMPPVLVPFFGPRYLKDITPKREWPHFGCVLAYPGFSKTLQKNYG